MIEKEKPRYLKEQFQKLKKIISENSLEIINNILKESIFKGITNLSIFEDLITASTVKKTVKTKSVSAPTAKIPEIMKNVVPEIRKISEYQEKLVKNL